MLESFGVKKSYKLSLSKQSRIYRISAYNFEKFIRSLEPLDTKNKKPLVHFAAMMPIRERHPFTHSLKEVILNVDKVPCPMLNAIREYKGGREKLPL